MNGDATLVRRCADRTMFAVIDALGHGPVASTVAQLAVATLERTEPDGSVTELMLTLDRALKRTRGAAALLGWLTADEARCCAVGNVDLRTLGFRLPVMLTPGVLGAGVRKLHGFSGKLARGDRLIVFSDGVSGRFSAEETRDLPLDLAAESILERYGRYTDDATVLALEVR